MKGRRAAFLAGAALALAALSSSALSPRPYAGGIVAIDGLALYEPSVPSSFECPITGIEGWPGPEPYAQPGFVDEGIFRPAYLAWLLAPPAGACELSLSSPAGRSWKKALPAAAFAARETEYGQRGYACYFPFEPKPWNAASGEWRLVLKRGGMPVISAAVEPKYRPAFLYWKRADDPFERVAVESLVAGGSCGFYFTCGPEGDGVYVYRVAEGATALRYVLIAEAGMGPGERFEGRLRAGAKAAGEELVFLDSRHEEDVLVQADLSIVK